MNEAKVKQDLCRDIRREGGYARRIEDRFAVGMPDVVVILPDHPVMWIEAKIIRYDMFGPTARQLVELKRLYRPPHCYSYLMGWKNDIHYITWPVDQIKHGDCLEQLPNEPIGDLLRRMMRIELTIGGRRGKDESIRTGPGEGASRNSEGG